MAVWRDIKGYEGKYQISDDGRVLSLSYGRTNIKRELVLFPSNTGYLGVDLCNGDGSRTRFSVHRLVAQTFIHKPDETYVVNHIDANRQNNHVENLEWVTVSDNVKHSFKLGNAKPRVPLDSGSKYWFKNNTGKYTFDSGMGMSRRTGLAHKGFYYLINGCLDEYHGWKCLGDAYLNKEIDVLRNEILKVKDAITAWDNFMQKMDVKK